MATYKQNENDHHRRVGLGVRRSNKVRVGTHLSSVRRFLHAAALRFLQGASGIPRRRPPIGR